MFWGYPYFDTNPFRGEAPNLCTSLPFGSSAHVVKMSKSGSQETSANLAIREVLGIHPPLGLLGMSFGFREASGGVLGPRSSAFPDAKIGRPGMAH